MAVIDASLLVALALNDHRAAAADALLHELNGRGEDVHAPSLLPFEVANGINRAVWAGALESHEISEAWQMVLTVPLTYHHLVDRTGLAGEAVIDVAMHLKRRSAYDAAYVALAQQLGTSLWTFDATLVRNGAALGYPVRLVEPSTC